MAVNYLANTQRPKGVRKFSLVATSLFARLFPRISTAVGYRLLMNPHAPKQTRFDQVTPTNQHVMASRAGSFTVHVFGTGSRIALLTHGWGDTSASFQGLIQTLCTQGYKVMAIDHVAHGQSPGKRAHLPAFIEALEMTVAMVEKQGDRIDVMVGHSMGGMAILNLPQLMLENVKVYLIAVPINFFGVMFETIERFGISRRLLLRVLEHVTPMYGKTWMELDSENHLSKLHPQVTFIHDTKDRYAPYVDVETYVANAPVKLWQTEGLGHRRILGDNAVIQYIADGVSTA